MVVFTRVPSTSSLWLSICEALGETGGARVLRQLLLKAGIRDLTTDRETVVDFGDPRGCPSCVFDFLPLRPGTDVATKRHRAIRRLDLDMTGIDLRVTLQRVFRS
jgi:hypothetical protein